MIQPITKSYGHDTRQLVFDYSIFNVTIKKGLVFDGASFPKCLYRWLQPFDPEFESAAVVHDAIYTGWTEYDNRGVYLTRKRADDLLVLILKENGVHRSKRGVIYAGVRLFGWLFYRKKEISKKP